MNNSEALGRIVWLMGHSRHHAAYKVSDIYRLILPAIANYQYRVHITGQDFVGGNNLWIVEMVMPFGNVREMLSEARKHLISLYGKGTDVQFRRTKNNLYKKVIL